MYTVAKTVSLKSRHLRFKQHGLSAWTLQRHCRDESAPKNPYKIFLSKRFGLGI